MQYELVNTWRLLIPKMYSACRSRCARCGSKGRHGFVVVKGMSESKKSSGSVLGKRHVRPTSEAVADMEAQARHWGDILQRCDAQIASLTRARNMNALKHRQHRDAAAFWRSFADMPSVVYGHPEWSHCVEVEGYRLLRFHIGGLEATKHYNAELRVLIPTVVKLVIPTHMDKDDLYEHLDGVHIGGVFHFETTLPKYIHEIWYALLDTAELKKQYDSATLSNHNSYHVLDTLDVEVDNISKNMRLIHDAHAILHVWIRDDVIDPILTGHGLRYVAATRQHEWLVKAARLPQISQIPQMQMPRASSPPLDPQQPPRTPSPLLPPSLM